LPPFVFCWQLIQEAQETLLLVRQVSVAGVER
jgi:hypothetical protein